MDNISDTIEATDLQMENLNLQDRYDRQRQLIQEIRSICITIRHACSNPEFSVDCHIHIENCMNIILSAIDNNLATGDYQYKQ